MTSDPAGALQIGIAAVLAGSDALAGIVGDRVYAPGQAAKDKARSITPYVEIGLVHVLDDDNQFDGDTEAYITLDIWADGDQGDLDAKAASKAIKEACSDEIPLDGFTITNNGPHDVLHRGDADGLSAHSVLTLHYLISPA